MILVIRKGLYIFYKCLYKSNEGDPKYSKIGPNYIICIVNLSNEKNVISAGPEKSQFTFATVWKNLHNDIHLLGIAVLSALAVAALNIQIPQLLGQIVNVVARNFASTASTEQGFRLFK